MSFAQPQAPEGRVSPGLTLNLPTNNPFRKGLNSPSSLSPSSPSLNPPPRPTSKNPFLDQFNDKDGGTILQKPMLPVKMSNGRSSPVKMATSSNTTELFNNLAISDKSSKGQMAPPPPYTRSGHRPSRSQEEEQRARSGGRGPTRGQTLDIFADPSDSTRPRERRPRRNSESSMADRHGKPVDSEEERRRRERRHREREARHRDKDAKSKQGASSSSKSKKPNHRLDVIDKLDVTSIYGTGLFHHDGPFDACNPHRNRKGSQRAPMQAFPKDSANNIIGGSGPVNKNINIAQFHGHTADGFEDFSASGVVNANEPAFEPYAGSSAPYRGDARPGVDRTTSFNPTAKVEVLHGDETMGLGTSTFLEGAPAARAAIQRTESETEVPSTNGGLRRKGSLAQKIRGISNNRKIGPRAVYSPEPVYLGSGDSDSAGGPARLKETNKNPFFNDYDDAYEKKGTQIQVAEERRGEGSSARARAPSSPMRGTNGGGTLERRVTSDSSGGGVDGGEAKSGGGFLSRVRSLRGGRRAQPQRGER